MTQLGRDGPRICGWKVEGLGKEGAGSRGCRERLDLVPIPVDGTLTDHSRKNRPHLPGPTAHGGSLFLPPVPLALLRPLHILPSSPSSSVPWGIPTPFSANHCSPELLAQETPSLRR